LRKIVVAAAALAVLALTPSSVYAQHGGHADHGERVAPSLNRVASEQVAEVRAAVERYRDFEVARREGWRKFGGDEPLMGEHWSHPDGPDYVHGDALDFSRPSNLIYTTIDGERVLTAVAFIVRLAPDEPVPSGFDGSADVWHVHDMEAAIAAATEERPILRALANWWLDENYRDRGDNRGRLAMLHVWVGVDNPDGVFADHNRLLAYSELGLPAAYAEGASIEAARGLHLLTPNGCAEALDGRLWIAQAASDQQRALHDVCRRAAAELSPALSADARDLNAAGEAAWLRLAAALETTLDAAQHARIGAMSEHGAHRR
jgi:hypothetical protein